MANAALLQGLTMACPPTLEQVQRQNRRSQWLLFIGTCLWYLLLMLAAFVIIIHEAWIPATWSDFWGNTFLTTIVMSFLPLGAPVLYQAIRVHQRAQSRIEATEALALRQAAAEGDETIAPVVANQPTSNGSLEAAREDGKWGPFKLPIDDTLEWLLIIGGFLVILGGFFLLGVLFGSDPSALPPWQISMATADPILSVLAAIFLVGGILSLLWGWRLSKGIRVQTDGWGVRWRRLHWWGTTRASLAWGETRAFYLFVYERPQFNSLFSSKKMRVYVLDAPQATLAWLLPAVGTAKEEAMHKQLCALIQERTGLPLRTLSATAEALEKRTLEGAANWALRKITAGDISRRCFLPYPQHCLSPVRNPGYHAWSGIRLQFHSSPWSSSPAARWAFRPINRISISTCSCKYARISRSITTLSPARMPTGLPNLPRRTIPQASPLETMRIN